MSSRQSDSLSVPTTEAAFPICKAMEILCFKNEEARGSKEVLASLLPKSRKKISELHVSLTQHNNINYTQEN